MSDPENRRRYMESAQVRELLSIEDPKPPIDEPRERFRIESELRANFKKEWERDIFNFRVASGGGKR